MSNNIIKNALEYLAENYQWIFSGIGVLAVSYIFSLLLSNKNNKVINKQKQ